MIHWITFFLFYFLAESAPVPPNYSLVPLNFYWDALPNSIPVLKSYKFIVTNTARSVSYGALSMFDATTKCWPNSFGPFTGNSGKRSAIDRANPLICGAQNKTVSQAYAVYLVLTREYPDLFAPFSGFMNSIGLDVSPDTLNQVTLSTDVGIGLQSGRAVANFADQDGVNSLGNATGGVYNTLRYSDYTDYGERLENTAYEFNECNQWQPAIVKDGQSTGFIIQAPISPQTRWSWSIARDSHVSFIQQFPHIYANCQFPQVSQKGQAYLTQAYNAAARVAALSDYTKMQAEFFEDKLDLFFAPWATLRFSVAGPISGNVPWTSDDDAYFLAVGDAAGYAGAVGAWSVKYYTKSVRPRSVIKNKLSSANISSWGGAYKGTVTMKGSDYESYLPTMGHPSYPSGTTCFAEAVLASMRALLNVDTLPVPIQITKAPGSSIIEPARPPLFGQPGIPGTPASTVTLTYSSLSEFAYYAGESRLDAGVHFEADVVAARSRCPALGVLTYEKLRGYFLGTATAVLDPNNRDHYPPNGIDLQNAINWFNKLLPE